jgi:hypothetical protein
MAAAVKERENRVDGSPFLRPAIIMEIDPCVCRVGRLPISNGAVLGEQTRDEAGEFFIRPEAGKFLQPVMSAEWAAHYLRI